MKIFKKFIATSLLASSFLFFVGCDLFPTEKPDPSEQPQEPEITLTLDFPEMSLKVGAEATIAGVHAEGLDGQMETYVSSDPEIVELGTGFKRNVVYGKKVGTTTIIVTYGELTKTITVTVEAAEE